MTIEEAYTIYKNCHKQFQDICEPCPLAQDGELDSICNMIGELEFTLNRIENNKYNEAI